RSLKSRRPGVRQRRKRPCWRRRQRRSHRRSRGNRRRRCACPPCLCSSLIRPHHDKLGSERGRRAEMSGERGAMVDPGFRVVVAGGGVAGLFLAETLTRARLGLTVFRKAGQGWGPWRGNPVPGLFVDVLSRQYEFPFDPNYNWSRKYAPASEIQAYISKVARRRGLTDFIRFHEEVTAAHFTDGRWRIETARGNSDVADVF